MRRLWFFRSDPFCVPVLFGLSSTGRGRFYLATCMEGKEVLILSRKRDEQIIINDNIVITVVEIRGDKVRLGVDAPREIPVHRREVYEAIARQNGEDAVDEACSAASGR